MWTLVSFKSESKQCNRRSYISYYEAWSLLASLFLIMPLHTQTPCTPIFLSVKSPTLCYQESPTSLKVYKEGVNKEIQISVHTKLFLSCFRYSWWGTKLSWHPVISWHIASYELPLLNINSIYVNIWHVIHK